MLVKLVRAGLPGAVLLLATPFPGTGAQGAPPAEDEAAPYGIYRAAEVEPGLLSAGQPTAEQLNELARAGFRTVLDLRGPDEDRGMDEAAVVEGAGMTYVSIPVTAETLAEDATFRSFFEAFATAERPVVVHCRSANRVGALYAAYLAAEEGVSVEEALDRGRDAGLRSEELAARVRAYLGARQGDDRETEGADPE